MSNDLERAAQVCEEEARKYSHSGRESAAARGALAYAAAAIRALPAQTEGWVSCSERLPEWGVQVIVYLSEWASPWIACRGYSRDPRYPFIWKTQSAVALINPDRSHAVVSHWMPLPAPPERGQDTAAQAETHPECQHPESGRAVGPAPAVPPVDTLPEEPPYIKLLRDMCVQWPMMKTGVEYIDALRQSAARLQGDLSNNWVSVDDRLPECGELKKCFACGKPVGKSPAVAFTKDGQRVFVGRDCYKRIAATDGYQPPKGGPQLYRFDLCPFCDSRGPTMPTHRVVDKGRAKHDELHEVNCHRCGASIQATTEQGAVDNWNNRQSATRLQAELAEARGNLARSIDAHAQSIKSYEAAERTVGELREALQSIVENHDGYCEHHIGVSTHSHDLAEIARAALREPS